MRYSKTCKILIVYHKHVAALCISYRWKKQLKLRKKKNFSLSKKNKHGKCLYKDKSNKTFKIIHKVLTKVNPKACKHIYNNYHNPKKLK